MIKQTYSKHIADHADVRVRPALLAHLLRPRPAKPHAHCGIWVVDCGRFPCTSAHLAREDRLQIIMLAPEELRAVDTFRLNIAGRARRPPFVNYFDTDLRLWEQCSRTQASSPARDRRHA